jgi:hypothetical protein
MQTFDAWAQTSVDLLTSFESAKAKSAANPLSEENAEAETILRETVREHVRNLWRMWLDS